MKKKKSIKNRENVAVGFFVVVVFAFVLFFGF